MAFISCRPGCGACCTELSISSAIPGMPAGKPAGVRCVQLQDDYRCRIFGQPERPRVCSDFQAERKFCGDTREDAVRLMHWLETNTRIEAR